MTALSMTTKQQSVGLVQVAGVGRGGTGRGAGAELNLCSKNPTPSQAEGRGSPAGTKPPDGAQDEGQGGTWPGPRGHVEGSHFHPQGSGKAPELVEGSAVVQF